MHTIVMENSDVVSALTRLGVKKHGHLRRLRPVTEYSNRQSTTLNSGYKALEAWKEFTCLFETIATYHYGRVDCQTHRKQLSSHLS